MEVACPLFSEKMSLLCLKHTVIASFVEEALEGRAHSTQGPLKSPPDATRHITNSPTSACSRALEMPITQEEIIYRQNDCKNFLMYLGRKLNMCGDGYYGC